MQKATAQQNIFVKGFPIHFGEIELKEMFGKHGEIISVFIQRDQNGHSKRNGVILFRNNADAAKAKVNLNGYKFPGGDEPMYVGELIP